MSLDHGISYYTIRPIPKGKEDRKNHMTRSPIRRQQSITPSSRNRQSTLSRHNLQSVIPSRPRSKARRKWTPLPTSRPAPPKPLMAGRPEAVANRSTALFGPSTSNLRPGQTHERITFSRAGLSCALGLLLGKSMPDCENLSQHIALYLSRGGGAVQESQERNRIIPISAAVNEQIRGSGR